MRDLYIYYKVSERHADALELRLRIMQAELGALSGVYGEIKRRPDSRDGLQTWMEIYAGTGDDFDAALSDAERDAALSELIEGERRTEVFMDLSLCA
ncbi:DUF4936 family protein [Massilia sp. RP-1-19]|uniref:DUF4936 family protein n=1 Tax=Massilia polaris TaxID=2728846 RepID=A0A848HW20_9BURK|nr:DUF4936 family protein [Massilia polaris]NML63503.1 DUF4936 family protein [Massilia polaris]